MSHNIIYNLILFRWKSFSRNRFYKKYLFEKILLNFGLISFYLPLIIFALIYPKWIAGRSADALQVTISLAPVFYFYFIFEIAARFIKSKPIAFPYEFLGLLVQKRHLIRSVLVLHTLNPINLTAPLFFTILAFGTVRIHSGLFAALALVFFVCLLVLCCTYGVLFLRLKSLENYFCKLVMPIGLILLISESIRQKLLILCSAALTAIVSLNPLPHLLVALLIVMLFQGCFQSLRKQIDVDRLQSEGNSQAGKPLLPTQRVSHWLALELKLVIRNHRPRTYLFTAIIAFIFFSLILFLPLPKGQNLLIDFYRLVALLFLSGVYVYGFGAFAISFHSRFFSFIATQPIDLHRWMRFKYYYFAGSVLVLTLVSLILIVPFHRDLLFPFIAFALWNAGPASLAMLWFATHNIDRCDLGKGIFMNFQAWGFYPSLIAQSLFVVPVVLYGSAAGLWDGARAWIVPAVVSLPLLVLHRVAIKWIAADFSRRKLAVLQLFQVDRGCG